MDTEDREREQVRAYDEELAAYMRTLPTTGDLAEDVRRICEENRLLFAELARELDNG